ncbi:hypothetical protein ACFX10_030143 [Malus domestica]
MSKNPHSTEMSDENPLNTSDYLKPPSSRSGCGWCSHRPTSKDIVGVMTQTWLEELRKRYLFSTNIIL